MKKGKRCELNALKGKIREMSYTYRSLAKKLEMSPSSLSNKLNGVALFDETDIEDLVEALEIEPKEIPKYFFPHVLRNAV